jgi:hypothetical protein
MIYKTLTCLCFAVTCSATVLAPPVAGTATADTSSGSSARANVVQSQRYDWLLETNRAFREARMRKECSPIYDPQLHQQCLASFGQYEPYAGTAPSYGSSNQTSRYLSSYGR